jgi:hypothetical protein
MISKYGAVGGIRTGREVQLLGKRIIYMRFLNFPIFIREVPYMFSLLCLSVSLVL